MMVVQPCNSLSHCVALLAFSILSFKQFVTLSFINSQSAALFRLHSSLDAELFAGSAELCHSL